MAGPSTVVAFQGVSGAYSEAAAQEFFGARGLVLSPLPEFASVFRAVTTKRAAFGVLPVENSLTGSIHQNYDLLIDHPVRIVGEVKLRVSHNLLAVKGATLAGIRTVLSHPQALAQCQGFLAKLKKAEATPFFDTAGSAKHVAEHGAKDVAAIASRTAGQTYGLVRLAEAIEDNAQNYTRFIVIEPESKKAPLAKARGKTRRKTSVVFAMKANVSGALHKSLSIFAIRDIDLVKIESRPIPGQPWQYLFYLDFATPADPDTGARAIEHLREITSFTRVLGTYEEG